MKLLLSTIVSVVVGAAAASATVVSLVNTQTAAPETSPASVSQGDVAYGATP